LFSYKTIQNELTLIALHKLLKVKIFLGVSKRPPERLRLFYIKYGKNVNTYYQLSYSSSISSSFLSINVSETTSSPSLILMILTP